MSPTTVTVEEETKEALEAFRAEGHHSWDDTIRAMTRMLPDPEQISEGCPKCDRNILYDGKPENVGGVIRYYHTEFEGEHTYGATWYCSPECAKKAQEEVEKMVPEEPDSVIVGGAEEFRTEFSGATFFIDGRTREVGLPIPGAFDGSSVGGEEYDYIGEPVYIKNEGSIVQHGVIEDIIHEEYHTGLILGHGHATVMLNHPDEERREEYKEKHVEWYEHDCPDCGVGLHYHEGQVPAECPECGAEVEPPEDGTLGERVEAVIEEHPDAVEDYHNDVDGAVNFLVGQVMEEAGGTADPGDVDEVIRQKLDE